MHHMVFVVLNVPALTAADCREFKKIILLGYKFAQRMDQEGAFERFALDGVHKSGLVL